MMVGRMIRRLSTVQEQEEEIEEEEEEERENGGIVMSNIHRRRLLELLIEQEAEIRHFEVKKLRQGQDYCIARNLWPNYFVNHSLF